MRETDTGSTPPALTVGQLREALASYAADTPLRIAVPDEEHPTQLADDRFIATSVGIGRTRQGHDWVPNPYVNIEVHPLPDSDG